MKKFQILIDIGNTNAKFILSDEKQELTKEILLRISEFSDSVNIVNLLKKKWKNEINEIESGLLISVRPSFSQLIKKIVEDALNVSILVFNPKMLGFSFPSVETTPGDDIIAINLAASTSFPDGSIIFSFGTANVALVNHFGKPQAVFIAPNFQNSWATLTKSAELLTVQFKKMPEMNLNALTTTSAIESGILFQQIGFVEKIEEAMNKRFEFKFPVFLTGENSFSMKNYFPEKKYHHVPHLIWEGMQLINQIINQKT